MDSLRIQWTESLRVGQPAVDEQNKKLIELIDHLSEARGPNTNRLLGELLEYSTRHFAAEESFMERVGYPELAEHRVRHRALSRTLLQYKASFDAGRMEAHALKQAAFKLVRDHALADDKGIGSFIKQQAR